MLRLRRTSQRSETSLDARMVATSSGECWASDSALHLCRRMAAIASIKEHA